MSTKYANLRAVVVYRATLDGTCETTGDVDMMGWHASLLEDFYGYDYVVTEDSQGFITVERFDHIDIDEGGYFQPARRAFDDLCGVLLAGEVRRRRRLSEPGPLERCQIARPDRGERGRECSSSIHPSIRPIGR